MSGKTFYREVYTSITFDKANSPGSLFNKIMTDITKWPALCENKNNMDRQTDQPMVKVIRKKNLM